jgi:hypothetical protein
VKTTTPIPSRYATGTIHGNVATGRANSLSVNSWATVEGRKALSQYGLSGESKSSLSQSSVAVAPGWGERQQGNERDPDQDHISDPAAADLTQA